MRRRTYQIILLAMAEDAAIALLALVDASGAAAQMHEMYGSGAFYMAFETNEAAAVYATTPVVDDTVLYHTRERVGMFGDLVLGAVAADRDGDVIVIVDVVADNTRTIYSKCSVDSRPTTIHVELVPIELRVDTIPEPLSDDEITRISSIVHDLTDPLDGTRTLYFVEAATTTTTTTTPTVVSRDQFESFVADLRNDPDLCESLRTLLQVYDTHDPTESVVVWVRSTTTGSDTVFLTRRRTLSPVTNTLHVDDD